FWVLGASRCNGMSWVICARNGVMVWLLGMQRAYGERRLQQAPRRSHSTAEVRTSKPDQYSGQQRGNAGLRLRKEQPEEKVKSGEKTAAQRLSATPAVSRASSPSEARAKAVGVGSTAMFGLEHAHIPLRSYSRSLIRPRYDSSPSTAPPAPDALSSAL